VDLTPELRRWLRRRLLRWGRVNFRDFEWRRDRDGYRTLITEVLLRQTSAAHIRETRRQFLTRYPTPESLARADAAAVTTQVSVLGFGNQRGPQLVGLARELVARGGVPTRRDRLRELPGVGDYTGAAVACFAFGRREPALDVNVARILARVLAIRPAHGELRKNADVKAAARALVDGPRPRELNWALLDLGALVCKPRPACGMCPLRNRCDYGIRSYQPFSR